MSNIAGKAYAMNVITPVPPSITWLQRLIFRVARTFPATLSGLLGLRLIHFARWVLIKRDQWPAGERGKPQLDYDYMLFCSNFNGTWDQYIDAFADGIPNGLDLFWYTSSKYPASIPVTSFKDYITHNQFHTSYYYNATPGSGQRDIKAALKLHAELRDLARQHPGAAPQAFAAQFRKSLAKIQNCLGSPGYAPVASVDTARADANRAPFVIAQARNAAALKAARPAPPPVATASSAQPNPPGPGRTTSFDSGRCFLTALLPISTREVVDHDGQRSSPVHMVRDRLALLATAHQSPDTDALPVISPFAGCLKTHFARMAVIEDTIYNGRTAGDAILDSSVPTTPRPMDELPGPYLMLVIDFDAPEGSHAELRDYLREMWTNMRVELEPIFSNCFGYSKKVSGADSFADYIIACQVETTMPFNDYWTDAPQLPSLSKIGLGLFVAAVFAAASVGFYALLRLAGLMHAMSGQEKWSAAIVLLAIGAGIYCAYRQVMWVRDRSNPMALNSDLPAIAKAAAAAATFALSALAAGTFIYIALRLVGWMPPAWPWAFGAAMLGLYAAGIAAAIAAIYALVMVRGGKAFPAAPDSDLKTILKALYLQRQFIRLAIDVQGAAAQSLYDAFGNFLKTTQPGNLASPRQAAGTINEVWTA